MAAKITVTIRALDSESFHDWVRRPEQAEALRRAISETEDR